MAKMNQAPTRDRKVQQGLPSWLLWLLGTTVKTQQPPDNKASQNGQRETPTLTEFSRSERKALSQDTNHETQMREWTQQMDAWFAQLHADPVTWEAHAFLQRLLAEDKNGQAPSPAMSVNRQVEVSAQALYRTFFAGEHNGDIEYFFQRIAQTSTVEQIQQHQKLIENLATMYGGRRRR